jgi:Cu/Ag efflux protein CusF
MLTHGTIISAVLSGWLISTCINSAAESFASSKPGEANLRRFAARGVVKQLKADGTTILLSHEAITNYMDAMTMPFKVKEPKELTDLRLGDRVSFRLSVSNTESWIDQVAKITAATPPSPPLDQRVEERMLPIPTHHPLLDVTGRIKITRFGSNQNHPPWWAVM